MKFKEYTLSVMKDRELLAEALKDPRQEVYAHSISNHGATVKFSFETVPGNGQENKKA